jgi:hypothetical protein
MEKDSGTDMDFHGKNVRINKFHPERSKPF